MKINQYCVDCIIVSKLNVAQNYVQTYIVILSHSKSFWAIFLKKLSGSHKDNQKDTSNNATIKLFQLLKMISSPYCAVSAP